MAQHHLQSKAYRDFPAKELDQITEEEAWQWFVMARWGSLTHMPCPTCDKTDRHYSIPQRRQWRCKHCHRVFSVTSETPLADRKLPFKELLRLFRMYAAHPKGLSANQVCGEIGFTFRTAFQNLNKIREAIHAGQDRTPMSGYVQIDGGHFCGKPRRPRKRAQVTSEIVNNHLKNRKANIIPPLPRHQQEPWNKEKMLKRRIVLVIAQLGGPEDRGTVRTITCVIPTESARHVIPAIKKYVAPGTIIHTDDGRAFSSLRDWYKHETVRHSVEYSTPDGVNNNQAECHFGMMRRTEYGVHHGMRPEYLAFYAATTAWYQDNRRLSLRSKTKSLLGCVMRADISLAFRGYSQGHRMGFEYLG